MDAESLFVFGFLFIVYVAAIAAKNVCGPYLSTWQMCLAAGVGALACSIGLLVCMMIDIGLLFTVMGYDTSPESDSIAFGLVVFVGPLLGAATGCMAALYRARATQPLRHISRRFVLPALCVCVCILVFILYEDCSAPLRARHGHSIVVERVGVIIGDLFIMGTPVVWLLFLVWWGINAERLLSRRNAVSIRPGRSH